MDNLQIDKALNNLLEYVEDRNWAGYDPYDIFNSKVLNKLNIKNRYLQIILTQLNKRSPINFRRLLKVEKGHNPKALGLFLSGYAKRFEHLEKGIDETKNKIKTIIKLLKNYRADEYDNFCWGYNWEYRTRAVHYPKFSPNIVATVFAANGFLDAYKIFQKEEYLKIARSSAEFILEDLNRNYEEEAFCCSYSPLDDLIVYNATMLGSKLLARLYSITGTNKYFEEARKSVEFVMKRQEDDGSWVYGALPYQNWKDSFHTSFVLESLYDYMNYSENKRYKNNFTNGLEFYKQNFFLDDYTPKYYYNKIYPIDIHSAAQAIAFFSKTRHLNLAKKITKWTIENMQDADGYFYYQITRFYTNKISYMRWSQAWMMYALSKLKYALSEFEHEQKATKLL